MISGEINESTKELSLEFIQIDNKEFIEIEVDITDILSVEELIQKINEMVFENNKYIKIILTGARKLELETSKILNQLIAPNIIKLKDKTNLKIDMEMLSKQNNLKGLFVKTLLEKIEEEPENKEKIEKAIEIGLNCF